MSIWLKNKELALAWIPTLLWAIVILGLSILPPDITPQVVLPHFDKVIHFFLYMLLAVLLVRSLCRTTSFPYMKSSLFTLILSTGYGILMELAQVFAPGHQADIYDIVANIIGVLCGIILWKLALWQK